MIFECIKTGYPHTVHHKTRHVVFDRFVGVGQYLAQLGPDVNKRVAMLS